MWTLVWSQQSATIYTMQIIQSTRHVRIEQLVTRKRQKLWLINLRWVAWSTQSCFIIWFLILSNSCKSQRFESESCFANLHLMLKRTDFVNYYVHNAWIQILNKKVMIRRELEECCKNHLPSYSFLLAIYELTQSSVYSFNAQYFDMGYTIHHHWSFSHEKRTAKFCLHQPISLWSWNKSVIWINCL